MRLCSAPVRYLLTCLALILLGGGRLPALAQVAAANKPILAPPPSQWDRQMLGGRPALAQTVSNFLALTGDIGFGMSPVAANAQLPAPSPGVTWSALPPAAEFQEDIRYFWVRLADSGLLRMGAKACSSPDSYVVFMFQPRGLFRISYRLIPDIVCPNLTEITAEIFGRYVGLTTDIALSVHYSAGPMEIIDVTDPTTVSYLLATRWQPHVE